MVSLAPASSLPDTGLSDKLAHALTYGFLTLWFCGAYRGVSRTVIGVGLVTLGAALEGLQGLTESRMLEVNDLVANLAGILAGMALATAGVDRWCVMVETALDADR